MRCKNIFTALLFVFTLAMGSGCNNPAFISGGEDVEASSESEEKSKAAYALYADKVSEYIDEYGEGETRSGNPVGVYYVQLLDFDADGIDELAVGYKDRTRPKDSDDHFDLWCYVNDSLKCFQRETYSNCFNLFTSVGYLGNRIMIDEATDLTFADRNTRDTLERYESYSSPGPSIVVDLTYAVSFLHEGSLEEGYSFHAMSFSYDTDQITSNLDLDLSFDGSFWRATFGDRYEFQSIPGKEYSEEDARIILEEQYGSSQWRPTNQDLYDSYQECVNNEDDDARDIRAIRMLGTSMIDETGEAMERLGL